MNRSLLRGITAVLLFSCLTGAAFAAPITFQFRFADPASAAEANGSITFEDTLLANPGVLNVSLPDPAVLALNVTVTGSASGNGTFGIADFNGVVFDTNGGTLNLGVQLVGQPTAGGPWGTPDSLSGDFNLFSGGKTGASRYADPPNTPAGANFPPNGVNYFTLGANGGQGEPMVLTGMTPAGQAAAVDLPLGRGSMLALTGLLGLFAVYVLRRRALHN